MVRVECVGMLALNFLLDNSLSDEAVTTALNRMTAGIDICGLIKENNLPITGCQRL